MRGLGIEFRTIDIRPACRQHFADIGHPEDRYDVVLKMLRRGNARRFSWMSPMLWADSCWERPI